MIHRLLIWVFQRFHMLRIASKSRRNMLAVSFSCFLSFVLHVMVITAITAVDSEINIITHPIPGLNFAMGAVLFQCIGSAIALSSLCSGSFSLISPTKGFKEKIADFFKSCALLMVSSFVFHIIAVCYGAPFFSKTTETFHFATLLTALVCFPCCLVIGPNRESFCRIFFEDSCDLGMETAVYITSVCSVLGAWLGAFPIPLDWDISWQEWPVSCALGAHGGYTAGLFLAALYLPRKFGSNQKFYKSV